MKKDDSMENQPHPSMQEWQRAWAAADEQGLGHAYADDGMVFPPNHASLKGPSTIVHFFRGGFSSVEVQFFPDSVTVADTLAFESGTVRDIARDTGRVVEECDYAVTWVRVGEIWKIRLHTWTIPREM